MEMRIGMDEDTSRFKNENPCASCDYSCDGWDASYCCRLCAYLGTEHCGNCTAGQTFDIPTSGTMAHRWVM